jgi:hypothetical protein
MKTIKYLVMSLCAALVAVACTEDTGLSQQNKGKDKPTVGIVKGSSNDGIIKFEVAASDDAAQYAYVVLAGAENATPDPMSILTCEVSGAEAGEAFSTSGNLGASPVASVTLDCSTFMTLATEYQVFAVAITETGLVGDVTSVLIVMNDTIAPDIIEFGYYDNTVEILFTEEVVRGAGKVSVSYYKYLASELVDAVPVPEADITVQGQYVKIVCPKPADGAVYMMQLEKGAFEDLSGNPFQAVKTAFNSQGQITGLAWMAETSTFTIGNNCFSTEPTDWNAEDAVITFKLPVKVFESGLRDGVRVVYNDDWGYKEVITSYTLAKDRQTVTVVLPEKPLGAFDVKLDEGLFFDDWGNHNAARIPDSFLYENYWLTIKGGKYVIEYKETEEKGGKFASIIEPYNRDLVLWNANWFNIWEDNGDIWKYVGALPTDLIGQVDYKTQTIIFDGSWLYQGQLYDSIAYGLNTYYWDNAQTQLMVFWGSGDSGQEPIVMTFDDEGYITSTTGFEYWIHDAQTGRAVGIAAKTEDGAAVEYVSALDGKPQQAVHNAGRPVAPFKSIFTR